MLGPAQVVAYAARFGFREPFRPFLSMALGAAEATLIELTSAYSVFPNHGVRMAALLRCSRSVDREGALLEEAPPDAARRHPRRHRLRDDQPAARRRAARHGAAAARSTGRSPARPAR